MDQDLKEAYKEAIEEDGLGRVMWEEGTTWVKHPQVGWMMATQQFKIGCGWVVIGLIVLGVALEVLGVL